MTPDEIELIRRRLEEQVKVKVEADLFRYYRNAGSLVFAVLASVGIFIGWPQLKALIVDQVDQKVEKEVAERVRKPVEDAKAAAIEAEKAASAAEKTAGGVLDRMKERQDVLKEDIGRINTRYDDILVRYGDAKSRFADLESELDAARATLTELREIDKLDPIGRAEMEGVRLSIADLARGSAELAAELLALKDGTGQSTASVAQQDFEKVATQQTTVANATGEAIRSDPRQASKVYVQFAGGARGDIERVSGHLRSNGWTVPPEERIGSAAGKHEIRYFHELDRAAALLLRDDYNRALEQSGFKPDVAVTSGPVPVKQLPGKGTLEVWIELPRLAGK